MTLNSNGCAQNTVQSDIESNEQQKTASHTHDVEGAQAAHGATCCSSKHNVKLQTVAAPKKVEQGVETAIRIMQMDCPTEEGLIRKKLGAMEGVHHLEFNLMQRVLTVVHNENVSEDILQGIRSLGYIPEVPNADGELAEVIEKEQSWWPLAIAGGLALLSEISGWISLPDYIGAVIAITAILFCGLETYKKGWVALKNWNLNINALMSIAVTGAFILGQWPEAAMVMVLFTVAELIEAKSLDRARNAIKGLMELAPEVTTVRQKDGTWLEVDTSEVNEGDIVRIKPGERIGLDGIISRGFSSVNQAPITGESLAVDKTVDDPVFAGTINESGSFEYKVTATANNTTLARIIYAVEQAQGSKAPIQRFVDKFSQIYTPIVFVVAAGIAVVPPLFLAGDWQLWIYKALVLLVIACPCALVISTPVTIVSGLASAARKGILIKGGVYLEQGRKLKWLALDKTGTITEGKPKLTRFTLIGNDDSQQVESVAYSLASRSDHPVSKAVVEGLQQSAKSEHDVEEFTALLGRGVKGRINEQQYYLGNKALIEELGLLDTVLNDQIEQFEKLGNTVILLATTESVSGLFAVADTVKASSKSAIAKLQGLNVKTAMLTGDNKFTAAAIASEVNIDEVKGEQLPEDKLQHIENWQKKDFVVGMVGDGINDAPALAKADIGFAMGAMGADTAIETADVALMDDDLQKIPAFIKLSQSAHNILVQNISLAIGIKVVFLAITLQGTGTMWMAVFADVGASLLVVANGLRLLRK